MTGRSADETAAAASGEKYCATPGGTTGSAPLNAAAEADWAAGTCAVVVDTAAAGTDAMDAFAPAVSFLISSRPSGPRKYDSAHRDWKMVKASSCTLRITKTRLVRLDS